MLVDICSRCILLPGWTATRPSDVDAVLRHWSDCRQLSGAWKHLLTYLHITLSLCYTINYVLVGGTDDFGHMMSYCRTRMKTTKWQPRVFTHLLRAAAVNAHILYRMVSMLEKKDKCYHFLGSSWSSSGSLSVPTMMLLPCRVRLLVGNS